VHTIVSIGLLLGVLIFAVARPRGWPELVVAGPAAIAVLVLGLVSWDEAGQELRSLGPTVGFLAAILALAHLADTSGVFNYAGAVAARWSAGSADRLLRVVFLIAAVTTAVLSLDATVVLLTPVVLATATVVGVRARPHVYACAHLANSASLLLPVSNLTNLLAFAASGLTFAAFAGLMALPWLVVIAIEYVVFRRFFAADLRTDDEPAEPVEVPSAPVFALVTLAVTLVGFGVSGLVGVHPGFVAATGALVLAIRDRRQTSPRQLAAAINVPFCLFVFALGIVVLAVRDSAFGSFVDRLVPDRDDFTGLLLIAVIAAVLANLLNNLPATLMLVPLVAHAPGPILAVLLGVNIGPNLTYVGSLATLLWRQVLHARDHYPNTAEFLTLGLLTVPACLLAGVAALWLGLRLQL
jgi:arsenical pump membrane protein